MAQTREVDIEILCVKFKVVPQNGRQEYERRLMALLTTRSLGYREGAPTIATRAAHGAEGILEEDCCVQGWMYICIFASMSR